MPDTLPRHVVESWHLADSETAHRMNQLLADDLVQQAGQTQRAAITEEFSFQQAEAQAMQRLRDRGVLPQKGTVQSLESLLNDSYASRSARTTAERLENQAVSQTTTTASSASASARIRLPTSLQLPTGAQLAQRARSLAPAVGRTIATGAVQTALIEGNTVLTNTSDDLSEFIGEQLPDNVEPYWDNIAGPNGLIMRSITPPNIAGLQEGIRLQGDLDRILNGVPARSELGGIAQQLTCSIFGVGCPTTTEGVPNLGSPGAEPPFYGGQSPGVAYLVGATVTLVGQTGSPNAGKTVTFTIGNPSIQATGPISNLNDPAIGTVVGGVLGATSKIRTQNRVIEIGASTQSGSYQDTRNPNWIYSSRSLQIVRADGQPDTGGNPAPSPDAENRPATAPALANRTIPPPANAPTLPSTTVPNPSTTPIAPTPTPPPGTGVEDPLAPLRDNDPLDSLIPLLGALPFLIPSLGKRFNPSGARQPSQGQPPATGTGDVPTPTCRYDSSNIAGRVDRTNLAVQGVQSFMEYQMMQKLDRIDAKLGPQIPGGGIAGFIKKTWDFLQVDRVLSILTWIGVLHNAYMLSNGLTQTLFSAISNVLDVFGIENAEGEALDVGAVVGTWTDNFFKSVFGVETVDGIKEGWKNFNRIYQAAANIIFSIQSITFSMAEMLETISNYTGRIGNGLKKAGVVLENAFNWMNPNANYTNNRFFNALNNTQEAIEAVDQVASETLSIQETGAELYNQKQEFDKSLNDAEKLVGDNELTGKTSSPGATIQTSDERKPE